MRLGSIDRGSRKSLLMLILGQLVLLIGLIPTSAVWADDVGVSAIRLSLVGEHRFRLGDDPGWSAPDFDDSDWDHIRVPGDWSEANPEAEAWIGWYRIHFRGEAWLREIQPAVLLGRISDADEVWLNGERIGGMGVIPKKGSPNRKFSTATAVNRLYQFSPELIRMNENNVIAIRVMRVYYDGGIHSRLPGTHPGVGDFRELALIVERNESVTTSIYGVLVLTYLAAVAVGLVVFHDRELRRAYAWLGCAMSLYAGVYAVTSTPAIRLGFVTPTVEMAVNIVSGFAPWIFLNLMAQLLHQRLTRPLILVVGVSTLLYLLVICLFGPEWRTLYQIATVVVIASPILTVPWWSFLAIKERVADAWFLVAGLVVYAATVVCQFLPAGKTVFIAGVSVDAFGAAFLVGCCLFVLLIRFRRLQRQIDAASQALLVAQEDERKRISRELHDGVNQSIFAMRLALQMTHEKSLRGESVDAESLAELVRETETVSDELRRIVAELRPSVLEQMSLVDALKWHADEMSKRCGLEISVKTDDEEISTSERVKDHVFRIWQEALKNVIQHARANSVVITVLNQKHQLHVTVQDDGSGIAGKGDSQSAFRGHGMLTIRERAELLGGTAGVISKAGQGTTIWIRVPPLAE